MRNENVSTVAYLNLALTWAKGVMVLLLSTFILIAQQNSTANSPKPKAEMIIELRWEDGSDHDLDLWVGTPSGEVIFYAFREAMNGLVTLERDDRGINNSLDNNRIFTRQEAVVFRALPPGNFAITALLYKPAESETLAVGDPLPRPIAFTVKIIRLNPSYQVVFSKSFEFQQHRQEVFVTRFTIEEQQIVLGENNLPLSLMYGIFPDQEFVMPDGASR